MIRPNARPNHAATYQLWKAGKRAKMNLMVTGLDWLSVVPFPLLYFFSNYWYLGFCLSWATMFYFLELYRMTPVQGLKRVRSIIAGNTRFVSRYSKRQRRFSSGN